MIIDADFSQLEILCAFYLSKDKVGYQEILNNVDIHAENQKWLKLPKGEEGRLIAKKFFFRLLYGGTEYAYANDPEFMPVSRSTYYWERVIANTYDKYKDLAKWHHKLMQDVIKDGYTIMPTGRVYLYERTKYGEWPRTCILNYPVQGFGADLMSIARISLYRRIKQTHPDVLLISTVHDSIMLDCPKEKVDSIVSIIKNVWSDIPRNYERVFGSKFDLPCKVKIKVGPTWGQMETVFRG